MATMDFIFQRKVDEPRHEQNMPEGIENPVPKSWVPSGPGYSDNDDIRKPGKLFGHAGPNAGYALTLAKRISSEWFLVQGEHLDDVETLLAEIAMRRASHFGRAPISKDLDFAAKLLGYLEQPSQGEEKWRPKFVHGCAHDEHKRRIIVNSIPQEIIAGDAALDETTISGWFEQVEHLF